MRFLRDEDPRGRHASAERSERQRACDSSKARTRRANDEQRDAFVISRYSDNQKIPQRGIFFCVSCGMRTHGADTRALSEANDSERAIRAKREPGGRTTNNVTRSSYPAIPIRRTSNRCSSFFVRALRDEDPRGPTPDTIPHPLFCQILSSAFYKLYKAFSRRNTCPSQDSLPESSR